MFTLSERCGTRWWGHRDELGRLGHTATLDTT